MIAKLSQGGATLGAVSWGESASGDSNIYVNSDFTGGGVDTAPNNHGGPILDGGGSVNFDYSGIFPLMVSDASFGGGRAYVFYNVHTNNPDLEVGETYRVSYNAEKLEDRVNGQYSAAIAVSNPTNITPVSEQRRVVFGEGLTEVFYEFTVDDPSFTLQVRFGSGTTSTRSDIITYQNPALRKVS